MKHYKSVDFLTNFRMSVPLHKRSLPIEDYIITFWWWFCW